MHERKENLPIRLEGPGTALRAKEGWGTMSAAYAELPAGTDLRPLLKGLTDDACQCPHWGYVLKGSIHVRYTDDTEEVISAGEIFYLPPGHTAWLEEESAFVEFSPSEEYDEVLTHVLKKASEVA
jgi:hypothetical protein